MSSLDCSFSKLPPMVPSEITISRPLKRFENQKLVGRVALGALALLTIFGGFATKNLWLDKKSNDWNPIKASPEDLNVNNYLHDNDTCPLAYNLSVYTNSSFQGNNYKNLFVETNHSSQIEELLGKDELLNLKLGTSKPTIIEDFSSKEFLADFFCDEDSQCVPERNIDIDGMEFKYTVIFEFEGKLVVAKINDEFKGKIVNQPIEHVLLKIENLGVVNLNIKSIIWHKAFDNERDDFIKRILGYHGGIPTLWGFSDSNILEILKAASTIDSVDPLKILCPESGENIFIYAANFKSIDFVKNLAIIFPDAFRSIGEDVITNLLQRESTIHLVKDLIKQYEANGGVFENYLRLGLQIIDGIEPDNIFWKQFDLLSKEKQKILYNIAYAYDNPFIYELNDMPVKPDEYSINLMWINKDRLNPDQEYLLGNTADEFRAKFIEPISKWAIANPKSTINVWIDGIMATSKAVENSFNALQAALIGSEHATIHSRDVRLLKPVSLNPQVFSNKIPIYFRVDLLRAIIGDQVVRNKESKYFVYSDIDMSPLKAEQIFDKKTVNFLKDYGFVMAKGGHLGFENGFQIMSGENQLFLDSHKKVIIDLSIEMALQKPNKIKEQQIYDTYPAMVTHFLNADGRYGKLRGGHRKNIAHFRYDNFGISAHQTLPLGDGKIKLKEIMPRKPVPLPRSHF